MPEPLIPLVVLVVSLTLGLRLMQFFFRLAS